MSKARKLQLEVDTTLKKAHEGAELWESDLEKYQSEPNNKIFDGLKRDLKKLQKLREQIKGWLNAGEIKGQDSKLQEARRSIEECMVRLQENKFYFSPALLFSFLSSLFF
jgi:CCR4-NOT transcription complex subunit 3